MLRSYRGIIFALIGLVSIGAGEPPKTQIQAEATKEKQEIAKSLESIATSLQRANESSDATKPCANDEEDRNSDLCAQWKAADAASDAARWAWWQLVAGMIGLLLGLVTMGAAIAAAWFAKGARDETKRSADLADSSLEYTKIVTQRQIEAFVYIGSASYHDKPIEYSFDNQNFGIVTFTVQNFGKTMAYDVSLTMDVLAPDFTGDGGKRVLAEEKFGGEFYPSGRIREYTIEFPWPDNFKRKIIANYTEIEIEFAIAYKLDSQESEIFTSHEGRMVAFLSKESDRVDFVPPYKGWHTND